MQRPGSGQEEGRAKRADPEITVLVAARAGAEGLLGCLEGLAGQLASSGTFEVIVVDDESDCEVGPVVAAVDGSTALLHVRGPGAAAAWTMAMASARAELCLLIGGDAVAEPDLVTRHLELHREAGGARLVQGAVHLPEGDAHRALGRYLEYSEHVPDRRTDRPEEGGVRAISGAEFDAYHASLPLAVLRRSGGFDADFTGSLARDADLGLRLERLGLMPERHPDLAVRRGTPWSLDAFAERRRASARDLARLFRKHPRLLDVDPRAAMTARAILERSGHAHAHIAAFEAVARTLAEVDLRTLERMGGAPRALAATLSDRLTALLPKLDLLWTDSGHLEGLREAGVEALSDLVVAGELEGFELEGPVTLLHPDPFQATGFPDLVARWLDTPDAAESTLCVWLDPSRGWRASDAEHQLEPLVRAAGGRVVPFTRALDPVERLGLFARVQAWIPVAPLFDREDRALARRAGVRTLALDPAPAPLPA